ncbi:MAG: peptidoglycan DD-metalloendopeptidase family protein [Burkholderiaceae bacterium]
MTLVSCAHRPPAPIESRTVQQADSPNQTSITGKPKPSTVPPTAQAETEQPVPAGMHRVKRGETLIGIALEYGVDWRELASWNQITNPNRIEVGQVLTVRAPTPSVVASVVPPPPQATPAQQVAPTGRIEVKPLAPVAGMPAPPVAPAPPSSTPSAASPVVPSPVASTPPEAPAAAPAPAVPAPQAAEVAADGLTWVWPANGGVITQFAEGGSKGIAIAGAPGEAVFAAERGRVVYSGNGLRGYGNLVIVKHANDFITAYAHNRAILVKEGQSVRRGQKIAELGMSDADRPMLHFELRKGGKPIDPLGFLPNR